MSLRANCPFYLRPHCPPTLLLLFWQHLIGSGERQFVGVQQVVGLIAHGCWPGRKCLTGHGEPLRGGGGAGVEVGIRNSGKHIVISHLTNPNQCCSALPLFKRTGSPPGGIQSPLLRPLPSRLPPTSSPSQPLSSPHWLPLAHSPMSVDLLPQPQPPNAFSIKHLLGTINSRCSLSLLVSLHICPSLSSLYPLNPPSHCFSPQGTNLSTIACQGVARRVFPGATFTIHGPHSTTGLRDPQNIVPYLASFDIAWQLAPSLKLC